MKKTIFNSIKLIINNLLFTLVIIFFSDNLLIAKENNSTSNQAKSEVVKDDKNPVKAKYKLILGEEKKSLEIDNKNSSQDIDNKESKINSKQTKNNQNKIVKNDDNQSDQKNKNIVIKSDEKTENKKSFGNVDIIGLERLDPQVVLELINLGDLQKNKANIIEKTIEKLHESELFAEVKVLNQSSKISIILKENPLIAEVKFIGNDKIDDEALQNEINLKKRTIFTKAKLQSDLKRITELYIKSGRFLVKIEPKIIQKDQNRIEVIFEINEGKKAKIEKIYFIGNQQYSDQELAEEVSTKESKWWRFLSSSDNYDSDRIEFDKEVMRRFYGKNGFADFTVISSTAQISKNKDRFFISFLLEEGIQYKFGDVNIINHIEKFDSSILQKKIRFKKGKIYDAEMVEKTVDDFVEVMSEASFAFGDVEPILKRNRETKVIDIDFVIAQTPRIYINHIKISGNHRTIDEVIRRELRFREGDPYNLTKINRSKQRIENLGFFEKVEFKTKRIDETDKVDLEIEVKEKRTGELTLGIGYSTIDRVTGNVGIRENNLFGTGQELGINLQKSYWRQNVDINYTKPYFFDTNLSAGIDLYKYEVLGRNALVYDQNSVGTVFRGSYAVTEFLNHQIRYSINKTQIGNIDNGNIVNGASIQGNFLSSSFGHTFFYDKRDSRINPRKGYLLSFIQEYSGVGGDIKFIKNEGSSAYYLPIYKNDFILKFSARGGVIDGLGQGVRSNYGYFLGGNDFRGFDFNGLGPRTKDANGNAKGGFALGGKIFYVGSAELRFPLGLPKELGIFGALFSENGTVKSVDKDVQGATYGVANSSLMRSSYGLSIVWSSPMGPIRLDFSKVAKKELYDNTQTFRFSFGSSF